MEEEVDYWQEHVARLWRYRPLFEFAVILQRGQEALLADTIDTLSSQRHDGWRLSIYAETLPPTTDFEQPGSPIRWLTIPCADDVSRAINARIADEGAADWFVFCACGVQFAPHFLLACGDHIASHADCRLIFTDEDTIDGDGTRHTPLFKPAINTDLLRSTDYLGTVVVERQALIACGGVGQALDIAPYDIALRILEQGGETAFGHLPELLQHVTPAAFRRASGEALTRCLQQHLARSAIEGDVLAGEIPECIRHIRYRPPHLPHVSILIANRNQLAVFGRCIESLLKQTRYPFWEIIVADNDSDDPALLAYYQALTSALPGRLKIIPRSGQTCIATLLNEAAEASGGEFLLLLANDTEALHDDWLDIMMSHAQRPDIGAVGARLVSPVSGTLSHAGLVLGMEGSAGPVFLGQPALNYPGYLNRAICEQNYSALSGACLLLRKAHFVAVGGLDDTGFGSDYSDIDLCLKVRALGLRNLWTPYATLSHGGSSFSQDLSPMGNSRRQQAAYELARRWRRLLADDPAWNRNLSLASTTPQPEDELRVAWNPDYRDRLRVLGMPVVTPGQSEYRTFAPFRALNAARLAQCSAVCQPRPGHDRAPTPLELARLAPDTLLIHMPLDDVRLIALSHYHQLNQDVLRIYSIDDLVTDIPQDNPCHRTLPRDVVTERLRLGLAACDRAIVSTEALADLCRGMIADIRIVPNMLDGNIWRNLPIPRREQRLRPRVGWAGAQQHIGDLRFLLDVVQATCTEVDWVFFGMMPEGAAPFVAEFHEFVHRFEDYPAKLATLDLDLAIAPLAIHPFNEAKSNLRLLEYGILGWPVIGTDIFPFRTGNPPVTRVDNTVEAWTAAIRTKIADRQALAAEGQALQQWVVDRYMLEDHLDLWLDALQSASHPAGETT